jgi:toxin ParE1/3/4
MTAYRFTPAARRDLSEIWDYTERRWDPQQAEKYANEIRAAVERVAEDPRRGRAVDEVRDGYRMFAVGSHLIFFIEGADDITVVRILHQRMDPNRHL